MIKIKKNGNMTCFFIICYLRNLIFTTKYLRGASHKKYNGLVRLRKVPGKYSGEDMAVLNNLTDSFLLLKVNYISGFGHMEDLHDIRALKVTEK